MNPFDYSSWYQCIETNKEIIMNHYLKSWNENKSIAHPSTCAFSPAKIVALKMYSIELK